jgi:hypothetical protein
MHKKLIWDPVFIVMTCTQNANDKKEIENATVGGLDKIHDTESTNSDVVLPKPTENNDKSNTG